MAREFNLTATEFGRVLEESGLGATRPINDNDRLSAMLLASNLVVTARLKDPSGSLVGVARCITDFSWCCYVSELAVTSSAQGLGIGRKLLEQVRRELGDAVSIVLISVPEAVSFYERTGMARVPDTFWFRRAR